MTETDLLKRELFAIHVQLRPGRYGAPGPDREPTTEEFDRVWDVALRAIELIEGPNRVKELDEHLVLWRQKSRSSQDGLT